MNSNIVISDFEKNLFSKLLKAANQINPNIILRISGGWVRDKLMNLETADFDIAVEGCSALEFAKELDWYPQILEKRPEQGKNVQTVIAKIHQNECYPLSLEITELQGTLLEDAQRRDLTINALFYNLNTGLIEDPLNVGLSNLEYRYAFTPIDAYQTFSDDPLRVLRLIRFAAKYQLTFAKETYYATRKIRKIFKSKVSVERIWSELEKIITGPNVINAIDNISFLGYRDLLFVPDDEILNSWDSRQNSLHHDLNIWEHTLTAIEYLAEHEKPESQHKLVRRLSMLFHDIGKCDCNFIQKHSDGIHLQYKGHEIASARITKKALDNLGVPHNVRDRVVKLVGEHMRLHHLEDDCSDKALRRIIRDVGADIDILIEMSIADVYGKISSCGQEHLKDRYVNFAERINKLLEAQGFATAPKRPINGHELMKIFDLKPGPAIGDIFARLDEKLLETPLMSKDEAIEFIRESL